MASRRLKKKRLKQKQLQLPYYSSINVPVDEEDSRQLQLQHVELSSGKSFTKKQTKYLQRLVKKKGRQQQKNKPIKGKYKQLSLPNINVPKSEKQSKKKSKRITRRNAQPYRENMQEDVPNEDNTGTVNSVQIVLHMLDEAIEKAVPIKNVRPWSLDYLQSSKSIFLSEARMMFSSGKIKEYYDYINNIINAIQSDIYKMLDSSQEIAGNGYIGFTTAVTQTSYLSLDYAKAMDEATDNYTDEFISIEDSEVPFD